MYSLSNTTIYSRINLTFQDNKHIVKRPIGLFAKKSERRHSRPSPSETKPICISPLSQYTGTSSLSYRGPQTHPPPLPLVTPRLQQQIAPAPSQAAPYQNPNAPRQTLSHPIIHQQIPPATHQIAPHQYHKALHETLPHASKQKPVREATGLSSSLTNTAIRQSDSI